jgi:putative membrane protein
MKKKISILVVAATLLAAPAFAQSDSEMSGPNPALSSTPKAEAFVKEVAATDLFEIASAKLATQRGDDNVKAFAEKMIEDHSETTNALKELASSGKVHAELPADMTIHQTSQMKRLESLQGPAFKKQYVMDQALTHKNAALLFKRYSDGGDNPDLQAFAKKYLAAIQMHWQMTQQLNKAAASTDQSPAR